MEAGWAGGDIVAAKTRRNSPSRSIGISQVVQVVVSHVTTFTSSLASLRRAIIKTIVDEPHPPRHLSTVMLEGIVGAGSFMQPSHDRKIPA